MVIDYTNAEVRELEDDFDNNFEENADSIDGYFNEGNNIMPNEYEQETLSEE